MHSLCKNCPYSNECFIYMRAMDVKIHHMHRIFASSDLYNAILSSSATHSNLKCHLNLESCAIVRWSAAWHQAVVHFVKFDTNALILVLYSVAFQAHLVSMTSLKNAPHIFDLESMSFVCPSACHWSRVSSIIHNDLELISPVNFWSQNCLQKHLSKDKWALATSIQC